MTDYRQFLVDAAVADLRHQLYPEDVRQEGTHVSVADSFKMARVIEAVMRVALTEHNDDIVDAVVRHMSLDMNDRNLHPPDMAADLLYDIRQIILTKLDPLP